KANEHADELDERNSEPSCPATETTWRADSHATGALAGLSVHLAVFHSVRDLLRVSDLLGVRAQLSEMEWGGRARMGRTRQLPFRAERPGHAPDVLQHLPLPGAHRAAGHHLAVGLW